MERRALLVVALIGVLLGVLPARTEAATPLPEASPEATDAVPAEADAPPLPTAEPPALSASGAVLWDPEDQRVLTGLEPELGRPMASTTKIMTVLLALEAGTGDDVVTVSPTAAARGEATVDLFAGQRLPMDSLIAGLLLRSGNDAATAVAEHVAGSEDAFVARMNARAAELGLDQTRFVNASGLTTDPRHQASPVDLARLGELVMGQERVARYAGLGETTVPGLEPMTSRNELLGRYPGATGIKTGFTSLAGNCLVASATRDGRTLYAVVLGADDSFADAAALLDLGFTAFRRAEPLADQAVATTYRWADGQVDVTSATPLGVTVDDATEVTWRARLAPELGRPLAAGDPVGQAELLLDGRVVEEVELVSTADAPSPDAQDRPGAVAGAAVHDALRALGRVHAVARAG